MKNILFPVIVCVLIAGVAVFAMNSRRQNIEEQKKSEITHLRIAHGLSNDHPVHIAMEDFAKITKEMSKGKILVTIYPSSQLGGERELIEQLQTGCMNMTKASAASLESFIPEMGVFGLPYIFDNSKHYWKTLDSPTFFETINGFASKVDLRVLCFYDAGSRNFYTKEGMVKTPADLKGKKIRVMSSKVAMDMVSAMGGTPTPISWSELYSALEQGVVEGAENNPPSYLKSGHYTICRNFSFDAHTRVPDILLIDKQTWNNLPADRREIIQQAALKSSQNQRKAWKIATQRAIAIMTISKPAWNVLDKAEQQTLIELAATQGKLTLKSLPKLNPAIYNKIKDKIDTKACVTFFYPDPKPFQDAVKPLKKEYDGTKIGELIKKIGEYK